MISAESPVVNTPAFVTSNVPSTVLPDPLNVNAAPVKSKLEAKSNVPLNNVVPVPATCVKLSASTVLLNVTSAAFVTVMSPVPKSPNAPLITTSPAAPASNRTDSLSALPKVELNVMS